MQEIQSVIDHMVGVYGMEIVPCGIPRNNFQHFKRYFYLLIKDKISEKLFYFLRDKVSPIKFLKDRPQGEIWLRKRNLEGRIEFEIELKPLPIEACIYYSGHRDPLLDINKGNNYRVRVYHQINEIEDVEFLVNGFNGDKIVDKNLSTIPMFRHLLRDYKLNKLI